MESTARTTQRKGKGLGYFLLTLLVLYGTIANGQQGPDVSIDRITLGKDFCFPLLKGKSRATTDRINAYLQLAELESLPFNDTARFFDIVARQGGKDEMDYFTSRYKDNSLTIVVDQARCRATCYYWRTYYHFNLYNGERYYLSDLIAASAWRPFCELLGRKINETLSARFDAIAVEDTSVNELRELARTSLIDETELPYFYCSGDTLYYDLHNWFLRPFRYYENLDTRIPVAFQEMDRFWSDYGRALFRGEGKPSDMRSSCPLQVYHGALDGRAMWWWFERYGDRCSGRYALVGKRKAWAFTGARIGGTLELEERDDQNGTRATISLQENGKGWQGRRKAHKRKSGIKIYMTDQRHEQQR